MKRKPMIDGEHQAWIDMFEEGKKVFGLSSNELNKPKYRNFFKLIEKWAYEDRVRRAELKNPEDHKGCLWDGEPINLNEVVEK